MSEFEFQVKQVDPDTGQVVTIGTKTIYNLDDGVRAADWVRAPLPATKPVEHPNLTSAINVKGSTSSSQLMLLGALGYFHNGANNVCENTQTVGMFSSAFSAGKGLSVLPANFDRVVALFAARKLITGKYANWINDKDEYSAPNAEHPDYAQWNRDAVVYSLFNTSSGQSALRNIEYKGKTWNIKNEWFWISQSHMSKFVNELGLDDIYQDLKQFPGDRFVSTWLDKEGSSLSDDAKEVLSAATDLVIKTLHLRKNMDPKFHLQTWDAGWYQIKAILKELLPEDLKAFRLMYNALADRMREGVYKFGFLKHPFKPIGDADV